MFPIDLGVLKFNLSSTKAETDWPCKVWTTLCWWAAESSIAAVRHMAYTGRTPDPGESENTGQPGKRLPLTSLWKSIRCRHDHDFFILIILIIIIFQRLHKDSRNTKRSHLLWLTPTYWNKLSNNIKTMLLFHFCNMTRIIIGVVTIRSRVDMHHDTICITIFWTK